MKILNIIFWSIWILSIILLVTTLNNLTISNISLFLILSILTGISMYSQMSQKKLIKRLEVMLKNLDFKPIEEEIKKIRKEQIGFYSKIFSLEDELGGYKKDREIKYRDVVRKVLEMDNKLNEKFKLVGEAVLKLRDEIKKN